MTVELERQLREDRALRSAARTLVQADLANLRADLSGRSISSRIFDRLGDAASDVYDGAVDVAGQHRGILATVFAALVLWFIRDPLRHALGAENGREAMDDEASD